MAVLKTSPWQLRNVASGDPIHSFYFLDVSSASSSCRFGKTNIPFIQAYRGVRVTRFSLILCCTASSTPSLSSLLHTTCGRQHEVIVFSCVCRKHFPACRSSRMCCYIGSDIQRLDQVSGKQGGIRYDDLLYRKQDRRHTRQPARSILLVGVRSYVSSIVSRPNLEFLS
jgi:hypothetical protein